MSIIKKSEPKPYNKNERIYHVVLKHKFRYSYEVWKRWFYVVNFESIDGNHGGELGSGWANTRWGAKSLSRSLIKRDIKERTPPEEIPEKSYTYDGKRLRNSKTLPSGAPAPEMDIGYGGTKYFGHE